jgi:tetratricopeptide (TPR) repeat protein
VSNTLEIEEKIALAFDYINKEKYSEAKPLIEEVYGIYPDDLTILEALFLIEINLRNYDEALQYAKTALGIAPKDTKFWNFLGLAFERKQKLKEAIQSYEKCIEYSPNHFQAHHNLASIHETNNDLEIALEFCQKAIKLNPDSPNTKSLLAKIYKRNKRYQLAIDTYLSILNKACSNDVKQDIYFQLGKTYDTIKQPQEAMRYFSKGNDISRKVNTQKNVFKENEWKLVETIERRCDTYNLPQSAHPPIAFLVGFPRSGTTLLERILDGHNDIQVLDEKETMSTLTQFFTSITEPRQFFNRLPRMRLEYFAQVFDSLEYDPNKLLVDKNPLYLRDVALIHYIFPHAKFILALRHPCDTCLSCFMQNFATTNSLANFTSLEDATNYYQRAMGVFLEQSEKFSLDVHRIRYEDLTADFFGESRRLLSFLNMPWQDDLDQYHKKTKDNVLVQTPSYEQVCRPIYKEARYRWLKYADYLKPHLEKLQPFFDEFGYEGL